jgi:hypothetical protein
MSEPGAQPGYRRNGSLPTLTVAYSGSGVRRPRASAFCVPQAMLQTGVRRTTVRQSRRESRPELCLKRWWASA